MPECVLVGKNMSEFQALNEFTQAYVEAAFWTEEERLKEEGIDNPSFENLADESLDIMVSQCRLFQEINKNLLEFAGTPAQNGHDFWLTRNHHGAGFWDRDYGFIGDQLTKSCKKHCECFLYVGDDGKIHID